VGGHESRGDEAGVGGHESGAGAAGCCGQPSGDAGGGVAAGTGGQESGPQRFSPVVGPRPVVGSENTAAQVSPVAGP
jgi:hypothetical protein